MSRSAAEAHVLRASQPALTPDPANDTRQSPVFFLPTLPADTTLTLAALVALFGPCDKGCRTIHLRGHSDDDLVEEGNKVDTQRILDAVPRIVASTARTLARLTEAQAELVTLDPALLGVVLAESAVLEDTLRRFRQGATGAAVRKVALGNTHKTLRDGAIAQRDVVHRALTQVLGPTRSGELALAQDASDEHALAAGLDHLADVIDALLKDGSTVERAQLERRRTGAPRAQKLRALAAALRSAAGESAAAHTAEPVTQRALDLQDGRVLVLLDALVGSMQTANRANRAIEVPECSTLAGRYRSRPRSERGKGRPRKSPDPNPPESKAPDAPR